MQHNAIYWTTDCTRTRSAEIRQRVSATLVESAAMRGHADVLMARLAAIRSQSATVSSERKAA